MKFVNVDYPAFNDCDISPGIFWGGYGLLLIGDGILSWLGY